MTEKQGIVSKAGVMKRTVTVTVHQSVRHPLYKKSYRMSKKFLVDTGDMTDIAVGDEVIIQECRPLSKNKHFMLKEVTKRVPRVSEMKDEASVATALKLDKKEEEEVSTPSK